MPDDGLRTEPGAVSPLSQDDGRQGPSSLSPTPPPPPLPAFDYAGGGPAAHTSAAHDARERQERAEGSAENPIILGDSFPVRDQTQGSIRNSYDDAGLLLADSGARVPSPEDALGTQLRPVLLDDSPPHSPSRSQTQAQAPLPPSPPPPPPPPPPHHPAPADSRSPSEFIVPRWQPDAEVTYCPICRTQFSIFVRKHHCRKCGRVVCNSCSPHRITIPYQYIVQPPGAPRVLAQRYPAAILGSGGGYPDFGVLGGGERVRLCNPCVPDPNIAPPQTQTQGSHSRSHSTLVQPFPNDGNQAPNSWGSYFTGASANDPQARSRSVTMHAGGPSSSRPPNILYPQNTENQILSGTPPPAYFRTPSATPHRPPYPSIPARFRSMMDVGERSEAGPSGVNRRLPPLPAPPPQIPEEDECPVCHRELPPRTLPNFESLRESHISICITAHSSYNGGVPASTSAGGGGSGDAGGAGNGGPPLPPMPPRRTGMFPYTATEKDCVDSAECTICLEEFEVGVPMARLECLCRFHRMCISAWWQRHPGRCPMHQHDGFGY
ncbi:hypothetical protein B0T26DRAFT_633212 [Lasiosphaeria miniovina]|uniref:RING-type E3 ubiquitin transferase n=1 Tax=Lasiosphaeria miniovina TaxID=1954250 RepID=A0AA40BH39_9PEZI|nr:uncharacterized protein B0T26DRAFT_633212 [Lasiosphaeria miniovina]KAK0734124.1 hypothetical protein B0T26DRAFT_633212 [Lasiosphaeria miniovina]